VIAIGGGGIYPMRARWERILAKYDEEKPNVQRAAQGSKERIDQRAQQRMDQARAETAPGGDGATSAHRV
jgi:hypothetical protein